jgi:molecular chaperone Hsp33
LADKDSLSRFVFENFPVRGELVHLNASWQAMLECHEYPAPVRRLLGEAAAAAVLLASILKFKGQLTLQIHGNGPLTLLVAQCSADLHIRGMAKWADGDFPESLAGLTGDGRLAITIETGNDGERYQGIVAAEGDTLAACLEGYFENSEQLPTRLWLAADQNSAAGMLLQQLPGRAAAEEAADDWRRAQLLADTLSERELMGLDNVEVLRRLFHEDQLRLFDPSPVAFRCSCSRERVDSALRLLGRGELDDLAEADGSVEVRCEFCGRSYPLDPVDLEQLFSGAETPAPPPSRRLH